MNYQAPVWFDYHLIVVERTKKHQKIYLQYLRHFMNSTTEQARKKFEISLKKTTWLGHDIDEKELKLNVKKNKSHPRIKNTEIM